MPKTSDQQILTALRAPQEREQNDALRRLVAQYRQPMMRLSRGMGLNLVEAEEVFQDAVFVFFQQVRKQDLQLTCRISTYLHSVVRKMSFKKIRAERKHSQGSEDAQLLPAEVKSVEASLMLLEEAEARKQKYAHLMEILDQKMTQTCWHILKGFYLEGMSLKELQQILAYNSVQVLKNQKGRCERKLRSFVGVVKQ